MISFQITASREKGGLSEASLHVIEYFGHSQDPERVGL